MAERVKEAKKVSAGMVAEACVMLVADPESRLLSGRYVDLEQDVYGVLEDLKGQEEDCVKRHLYQLKIETLHQD